MLCQQQQHRSGAAAAQTVPARQYRNNGMREYVYGTVMNPSQQLMSVRESIRRERPGQRLDLDSAGAAIRGWTTDDGADADTAAAENPGSARHNACTKQEATAAAETQTPRRRARRQASTGRRASACLSAASSSQEEEEWSVRSNYGSEATDHERNAQPDDPVAVAMARQHLLRSWSPWAARRSSSRRLRQRSKAGQGAVDDDDACNSSQWSVQSNYGSEATQEERNADEDDPVAVALATKNGTAPPPDHAAAGPAAADQAGPVAAHDVEKQPPSRPKAQQRHNGKVSRAVYVKPARSRQIVSKMVKRTVATTKIVPVRAYKTVQQEYTVMERVPRWRERTIMVPKVVRQRVMCNIPKRKVRNVRVPVTRFKKVNAHVTMDVPTDVLEEVDTLQKYKLVPLSADEEDGADECGGGEIKQQPMILVDGEEDELYSSSPRPVCRPSTRPGHGRKQGTAAACDCAGCVCASCVCGNKARGKRTKKRATGGATKLSSRSLRKNVSISDAARCCRSEAKSACHAIEKRVRRAGHKSVVDVLASNAARSCIPGKPCARHDCPRRCSGPPRVRSAGFYANRARRGTCHARTAVSALRSPTRLGAVPSAAPTITSHRPLYGVQ